MSLSSFHVAPRCGHLNRLKRICGHLKNMKNFKIRFCIHHPDYSDIPEDHQEWFQVYRDIKENLSHNATKPLEKSVTLTHYVDANLFHDTLTGHSVTACLHFINGTPIECHSKKKATVETATYGSEFMAARTCVEQIIDLYTTLWIIHPRISIPN